MPIDASYLAKLQDYYTRHNVIPSCGALGAPVSPYHVGKE